MTDITYQTGTSEIPTHGTSHLANLVAWFGEFTEGIRDGQKIATRYHELSLLSGPDLAIHGLTRQTIARAALTGH